MQRNKAVPMTRSLLIIMVTFTCLIRMYGTVSFPLYAVLQCALAGLFVLSTSIYGAFRIRNGDKENKSYMERIARYDALDASRKMENQI
ncbi:hypothetical protein EROM_081330 [Encephalitozoon romaleae SJ-2008]|uniref:Uncharacterized protein n=1 Tax=Encephalitozoon romaleae (strain SJ-2008) TaxID=1178016 RepID=I7AP21_ENCRO|nr:hypothetical protein EROM_081330 [Encephalitozoon romaleae SJ-2008]AFN83549.1 hypothetical protein EROM_081330 [Encephalitozoon romaleae SJ-2008]